MKDKLGNRSNASTEMEFKDTLGIMVGDEGKGIKTIMDMVTGNRIYCAMSSAGIMRQSWFKQYIMFQIEVHSKEG